MITNSAKQIRNILIIKPGAIGDLLQLTPVVRALKNGYPHATISLLVGSAATAELFKNNAYVGETIVFDKRETHKSLRSMVKLWRLLRRNRYDLILNFQRSNIKTWLLATAAFPCRIFIYRKERTRTVHAVINYLETIAPLGVDISNIDLEFTPGADDRNFAAEIVSPLKSGGTRLIALNPGASHRVNRWRTSRFAALADMLAEKLPAKVIVTGGPDDVTLAEEIYRMARSKPLLVAGKINLLRLGALLEQCDLLVSGDTGPMHLATAVGTKVVALFGAADPARTGPVGTGHMVIQAQGVSCVPCGSRACNNSIHLECMEKISAEAVFDAIRDMLKNEKVARNSIQERRNPFDISTQ